MKKSQQVGKSGTIPKDSGQWAEVDANGKKTGREITGVAGKPLPPTEKRGQRFVLVDKTKHKK